ncbi:hypothetical protein [Vannielia sp. SX4]|uniref:hypothetical protein n=1 Tax=Vannielia sp. SX4 TaxID=3463852 RepID=UPI0040587E41
MAFETFQRHAVAMLANVQVNRQQARRLERTVDRKNEEAVKRVAAEISTHISGVVQRALESEEPKKALSFLAKLVKLSAIGGTAVFATLAGINEGLDLIERLNGDQPIHEIIKELSNHQPEQHRKEIPEDKAEKP